MSRQSNPPQQAQAQKIFFVHDGTPSDSGSSGSSSSSSQDEGGNPGAIPARLLPRAPQAARRAYTQPVPGAASVPAGGGASSYYAALPPPPPIELKFPKSPFEKQRPVDAGGSTGAPAPADSRFAGAGQPASSAYPGGAWHAGTAMHAPGSEQPGPSYFPGSLGNPLYPAPGQSQTPLQHHAGSGRPAQANPIVVPRAETNELCQYCGRYFPVSQLPAHLTQSHPRYYRWHRY